MKQHCPKTKNALIIIETHDSCGNILYNIILDNAYLHEIAVNNMNRLQFAQSFQ